MTIKPFGKIGELNIGSDNVISLFNSISLVL